MYADNSAMCFAYHAILISIPLSNTKGFISSVELHALFALFTNTEAKKKNSVVYVVFFMLMA
jgi:hypothetical protein